VYFRALPWWLKFFLTTEPHGNTRKEKASGLLVDACIFIVAGLASR